MNFALVAMVGTKNHELSNNNFSSETNNSINGSLLSNQNVENEAEDLSELGYKGEFDWSSGVQSIIISVFYWWYVVSQVRKIAYFTSYLVLISHNFLEGCGWCSYTIFRYKKCLWMVPIRNSCM